jgi:excisionase family DNA binding protein
MSTAASRVGKTSAETSDSNEEKRDDLLTVEETAAALGVSKFTIYQLISDGHLHPVTKRGDARRRYVCRSDIETELERRRSAHPTYLKRGRKPPLTKGGHQQDAPRAPRDASKYDATMGSIAARAATLFGRGGGVREAVVELQIEFDLAESLYTSWKKFGPEWHLDPKSLVYLRGRLAWTEDSPTPAGFLAAVQKYIDAEIERRERERAGTHPAPGETRTAIDGTPSDPKPEPEAQWNHVPIPTDLVFEGDDAPAPAPAPKVAP